jgi:hypothetical protein
MSALNQAAIIIASTGDFAPLSIIDVEEFKMIDHEARVEAAAAALRPWISHSLFGGILDRDRMELSRKAAGLVAYAMVMQHKHTQNENAQTDAAMAAEAVAELRAAERALAAVKELLGAA